MHALAISAKGFEGVGPVFRVDATVDAHGTAQARAGKVGALALLVDGVQLLAVAPPPPLTIDGDTKNLAKLAPQKYVGVAFRAPRFCEM